MIAGASLATHWVQTEPTDAEVLAVVDSPTPVAANTVTVPSNDPVPLAQPASLEEAVPLQILNELDDLRMDVEATRDQLAELQRQVNELSDGSFNGAGLALGNDGSSDDGPNNANLAVANNRFAAEQTSVRDALRLAGVPDDTASLIQRQQDQQTLNRLELLDRAGREGWANTDRLDAELENLEASSPNLREQLGDDAYDRYLYHAGRPNRVVVASVIEGSVADQAGIQAGDSLLSYDANRLFSMQDLRSSIQQGVRNEPVVLQITRDGQFLTMDAVRGPLGITMSADREKP